MEKQSNNKFYKFITFPERLNSFVIYLFIILLTLVDTLIIVFLVPKVDYSYLPDYKERTEYDWMNPYVRVITNYYNDDNNKIYSSMTVTFCYFGVDVNHKVTRTMGSFTIIDDKDEIYYVGDLEKSSTTSYSTTSTPLSRLSKSLTGIKTVYGKVEYDKMFGGVKQGEDVILFKEEMIDLTKKEIKNLSYSEESAIKSIIEKYVISVENENDKYKITNKIDLFSNLDYKYHFDYQLFAVTEEGEALDIIGIYNFSTNYSRYITLDAKIPNEVNIKYFIGVLKININNKEEIMYIKKDIEDL